MHQSSDLDSEAMPIVTWHHTIGESKSPRPVWWHGDLLSFFGAATVLILKVSSPKVGSQNTRETFGIARKGPTTPRGPVRGAGFRARGAGKTVSPGIDAWLQRGPTFSFFVILAFLRTYFYWDLLQRGPTFNDGVVQ